MMDVHSFLLNFADKTDAALYVYMYVYTWLHLF